MTQTVAGNLFTNPISIRERYNESIRPEVDETTLTSLRKILADLGTRLADQLIGFVGNVGRVVTLNRSSTANQFANVHLQDARETLRAPYVRLMRLIAPDAPLNSQNAAISCNGAGFAARFVEEKFRLRQTADPLVQEGKLVQARLYYAAALVTSFIANLIDMGIAPFATIGSLIMRDSASLNNLAQRTLQFPQMSKDCGELVALVINPQPAE